MAQLLTSLILIGTFDNRILKKSKSHINLTCIFQLYENVPKFVRGRKIVVDPTRVKPKNVLEAII